LLGESVRKADVDIDFLIRRVSAPAGAIGDEAPTDGELRQILEAGLAAPDHGQLRPWRMITVRDDALRALGDAFADGLRHTDPDPSEDALRNMRSRPLRAPLIVVVVASPVEDETVSRKDQVLSAGAVAQQVVLAADALGYGSVWLTGPMVDNPVVTGRLGLTDDEEIVAFVYIGRVDEKAMAAKRRAASRPALEDLVSEWTG
jgi:nitroreductase